MIKFDKIIDVLNNEKPNLILEKEKKTFILLKYMQKNIENINSDFECEHDKEMICAFIDKSLDFNEEKKIKEIINTCDNCFELYNELKESLQIQAVKTPQDVLDKFLVADNLVNKQLDNIDNKLNSPIFIRLLKELKNNIKYIAPSIAFGVIAGIVGFIYIPNKNLIDDNNISGTTIQTSVKSNQSFDEGLKFYNNKDYNQAIDFFLETIKESNNYNNDFSAFKAHFYLSKCYEIKGDKEHYKKHLEAFLNHPLKEEIKQNILEFETKIKEIK